MERVRNNGNPGGLFEYLKARFKGTDQLQIDALDDIFRVALLYGTPEQAAEAIKSIRIRENFHRREILGSAALELIADMRAMIEQNNS